MIYWRRYGADYLVSTIGFTMEMDGAYGRLLDTYYEREGPLPLDEGEIMEIARATKESDREAVRKVIARKFEKRADGYHHARADAEIALAQTARDNGGKHVGKSGKQPDATSQSRTAKRGRKVTENVTGTPTEEVTRDTTESATHSGHPYNRTTTQPSNLSTNSKAPRERFEEICGQNRVSLNARGRMHLDQWLTEGVQDTQLADAIAIARERKPDPEVIPLAYLVPIVSDLRAGRITAPAGDPKDTIRAAMELVAAREAQDRALATETATGATA